MGLGTKLDALVEMEAIFPWPDYSKRVDDVQTMKRAFDDLGYIKVPEFLSHEEIDVVKAQLHSYCEHQMGSLPPQCVFSEDKSRPRETLIRLECMQNHSEFFKGLSESTVFKGLADVLLGLACEPKNVQYFSKPPGAKATPPHQDGKYFMHGKGITFWLALENADEENGCLYYVPGSHKLGELEHRKTGQLGFSQSLSEFPFIMKNMEEKQEVLTGTLLAHHPYTVHRAGENRSAGSRGRPALGFTYWAQECRDDVQLHGRQAEYQSRLVEELRQENRI